MIFEISNIYWVKTSATLCVVEDTFIFGWIPASYELVKLTKSNRYLIFPWVYHFKGTYFGVVAVKGRICTGSSKMDIVNC